MIKRVIKRDGRWRKFKKDKIEDAIQAAFLAVDGVITPYAIEKSENIADFIAELPQEKINVEEVQDYIENGLMSCKRKDVAKAYIKYREERTRARGNPFDATVEEIVENKSDYWSNENSNKDARIASTQRDYIAGAVSTDWLKRKGLPLEIVEAHDEGLIHFHDADYFIQQIHNCDLINLEDMLQNGTMINGKLIERPKSLTTAMTVATQISPVVASGQYGGQSMSLAHIAPFVDVSRQKFINKYKNYNVEYELNLTYSKIKELAEADLNKEIIAAVQTLQYQINTINTSNGQTPFITIYICLGEAKNKQEKDDLAKLAYEVFNQRILGMKNKNGVYVTPAFPKLIYVLDEDNIGEDSEYFWLTEKAAECTAKRMVPDYISAKIMKELKGDVYTCMGCRSFLTPDRFTDKGLGNIAKAKNYVEGEHKYYGRFNQGVVTINLPDVALTAKKEDKDFWKVLEDRCELCHTALRCRHERLLGTKSDISPIHWQDGALARLEPGETIDKLLYDGYSTISLGFAGLWECVLAYTGYKLTEEEGKKFGLEVMQKLNDFCAKWKAAENIDYSLYGTPLESTTYKFARCLQNRFGKIKGITDKDYITNSYHVHVTEPIDAFSKLKLESEFQKLSPGGAISYVECPSMTNNIPAVLEVMRFIYDNIMYAELNIKSDYCQECGFDGEMQIDDNMNWYCPNCGCHDKAKLNVARRTCGYIGSNFWNKGRTQEIKERVVHLDNE